MTTMTVSPATAEAVDYVLANLWERGQRELEILKITPEVVIGIIAHQRDNLDAPTMAILIDDEPVIICGLMPCDHPRGMKTWFQATEQFSAYARPITIQVRGSLERAAEKFGLDFMEIFSPCVHPRTGRWFAALGFNLDVHHYLTAPGGERLYRFERRFDRKAGS